MSIGFIIKQVSLPCQGKVVISSGMWHLFYRHTMVKLSEYFLFARLLGYSGEQARQGLSLLVA